MISLLGVHSSAGAQIRIQAAAGGDPVYCFSSVNRDAYNATQAFQLILGPEWAAVVSCRGAAVAAPELEPCWALLMQARQLLEQMAVLYQQPNGTQEGNAINDRARAVLRQTGDCFAPILARWTKNGGRYVSGDQFHAGSTPAQNGTQQGGAANTPPDGSSPSGGSGQAAHGGGSLGGSSAGPTPVVLVAKAAADAIIRGNPDPSVLSGLIDAQQALPGDVPRPVDCWEMMVDAYSKMVADTGYAAQRAQQAVDCYTNRAASANLGVTQGSVQSDCKQTAADFPGYYIVFEAADPCSTQRPLIGGLSQNATGGRKPAPGIVQKAKLAPVPPLLKAKAAKNGTRKGSPQPGGTLVPKLAPITPPPDNGAGQVQIHIDQYPAPRTIMVMLPALIGQTTLNDPDKKSGPQLLIITIEAGHQVRDEVAGPIHQSGPCHYNYAVGHIEVNKKGTRAFVITSIRRTGGQLKATKIRVALRKNPDAASNTLLPECP